MTYNKGTNVTVAVFQDELSLSVAKPIGKLSLIHLPCAIIHQLSVERHKSKRLRNEWETSHGRRSNEEFKAK